MGLLAYDGQDRYSVDNDQQLMLTYQFLNARSSRHPPSSDLSRQVARVERSESTSRRSLLLLESI